MELIQWISRYTHITFGFVGLAVYWVPIFAPKGMKLHVRFGRVFKWCAYIVTASALFSCVLHVTVATLRGHNLLEKPEQLGFLIFLAYLSVATFSLVWHAVSVLEEKKQPERVGTVAHRSLAWASIAGSAGVVAYALLMWSSISPILLLLSPVGISAGGGMLRYVTRPPKNRQEWFFEHMGAMIGAGIAFHTAFAVFGLGRLLPEFRPAGAWQIVPWILPTAIGVPASIIWARHYRKKFAA